MAKTKIAAGLVDIRLAMDPTSGMAQDGAPRYFAAMIGDKLVKTNFRDKSVGAAIRQALVNGKLEGTTARYERTEKIYSILVNGIPVGQAHETVE